MWNKLHFHSHMTGKALTGAKQPGDIFEFCPGRQPGESSKSSGGGVTLNGWRQRDELRNQKRGTTCVKGAVGISSTSHEKKIVHRTEYKH